MSETYYIRVAKRVLKVLERVDFPFYFSRFSKKTYTLRQHFVLLVIRQVEGKSYYSFAESLKDLNRLTDFLGLKKLPDGSTLQKAAKRIGNARLDKLLLKFAGNRSNLQEWVLIVRDLSFSKLRIIILTEYSIKLKKKKRREYEADLKNLNSKISNTQPLFQM